MRLNRYIALATGMSRRKADAAIGSGQVTVNNEPGGQGQSIGPTDTVVLSGNILTLPATQTIALHKPVGYVCSRAGQGSKTIYELLPPELHALKSVGRLDKDSSGLLLMTTDGTLANRLTHPSFNKPKSYAVSLDKALTEKDARTLQGKGVQLEDGASRFDSLDPIVAGLYDWEVVIHQGRNRQIRRTFEALGYHVTKLHRETFGPYHIGDLPEGQYRIISN